MIVYRKYRSIEETLYFITVLRWNINIVSLEFHRNSQLPELFRDHSKVVDTRVANSDLSTGHSRHSNERTYFDHIGQQPVFSSPKFLNPIYYQQVTAYATDLCAHTVQH